MSFLFLAQSRKNMTERSDKIFEEVYASSCQGTSSMGEDGFVLKVK